MGYSTAYVSLVVNNYGCYGLVDSGAGVSLCSVSILPQSHVIDKAVNIRVTGVTGTELKILGIATVRIILGDFSSDVVVHVVEKMTDNVFIIGRDILETFGCVINYRNLIFSINGHQLPLLKASFSKKHAKSINIHCSKTITVPANSIGSVPCHLQQRYLNGHRRLYLTVTGYIEPQLPTNELLSDLALINTCRGKSRLQIINSSDEAVLISQGTKIGIFTAFSPIEINTLNMEHRIKPGAREASNSSTRPARWCNIDELYSILGIDKLEHLSPAQKNEAKSLISDFRDIFSENDADLGCTDLMEQEIVMDTQVPIRDKYYNVPLSLRAEAEKAVKQLMDLKIIEPSSSPYHSPSFLMKKGDGSGAYRILTDYRKINKHIVRSFRPLMGIQEMVALWHNCGLYSKIDFAKGFYQTPIKESSRKFTATSIPGVAFWQYCRSPLGLSNSPCYFQSLVEKIFMGLKQSQCVCYLDDVLTGSPSFHGMIENLRLIFERVRNSKMLLKAQKCELFKEKLKFLGVILDINGISTCPEKVDAMVKMSPPGNVKGVRSFLGMSGFYRRFVKDYSKIAEPLSRLTKKNVPFKWTTEEHGAWEAIRAALVKSPVLSHPDLSKRFTLIVDASSYAIGSILTQADDNGHLHPVSYGSSVLSEAQRNWSTVQRELYSLMYFCEKYQSFLLGVEFDVITDNSALLHLENFKNI